MNLLRILVTKETAYNNTNNFPHRELAEPHAREQLPAPEA